MEQKQWVGMGLTILGALLWGLSGTAVQFIEDAKHVNVEWLLEVRLIGAGLITVILAFMKEGTAVFNVFKSPKDIMKLLIFGIFGMAMCQYTYFRSIALAGVGISTVLQYVAPTMIIVYLFLRYRNKPSSGEVVSVFFAILGTMLIMFQGGLDIQNVNGGVLFWGLLSALGITVYSLQPVELLRTYGTGPIVGFAMLISGMLSISIFGAFESKAVWDHMTWLGLFTIIILGTVVSFNAYMEGVRRIGAVQGSILSSLEPISAAMFGWALLGNEFTLTGILGMVFIISTVFIIGWERHRRIKREVLAKLNKAELV